MGLFGFTPIDTYAMNLLTVPRNLLTYVRSSRYSYLGRALIASNPVTPSSMDSQMLGKHWYRAIIALK